MEAEKAFMYLENNIDALDEIVFSEDLGENEILRCAGSDKIRTYNMVIVKRARVIGLYIKRLVAAAAVLVLVVAGWKYMSQTKNSEVVKTAPVADVQIRNTTQQDQRYALPDGSEVVLRPEAVIVYKKDFNAVRTVTLVAGDAYFKVYHDPERPFNVLSNGIATRALGTRFWVRNFKTINALSIALTEGKVMVYSDDGKFAMDPVYLKPGQTCAIDKTTGKVAVSNDVEEKNVSRLKPVAPVGVVSADSLNRITSSTNSIRFSSTTLKNVFAKLEERYNVKIVAEDPRIMNYNITGTIFYRDSLDVIMKSICELNNLMYVKRNDSLYLKKR